MVIVRAMTRIPYVRREEPGPEGQQLWDSIVNGGAGIAVRVLHAGLVPAERVRRAAAAGCHADVGRIVTLPPTPAHAAKSHHLLPAGGAGPDTCRPGLERRPAARRLRAPPAVLVSWRATSPQAAA